MAGFEVITEASESRGEVEVRRYLISEARKRSGDYFAAEPEQPALDLRGGEIARVVREAALADHADLVIIGRALRCLRTHHPEVALSRHKRLADGHR